MRAFARGAAPPRNRGGSPAARALLYLLALAPALALLAAVARNAVDMPVWDDWQFVPLLAKVHHGEIPWGELAAPHDEHRILLPRIVIVASMLLSGGNYRVQCFISVGTMGLLSLALLFLLRRTFGSGRSATPLAWLLANLILFSPIQLDNWLWPMQFAYFLPFMFMGLCLAAFFSDMRAGRRLALCGLCAWAGTYSFINGLLIWPVMLPALLHDRRFGSARQRRLFSAAWLGSAGLATGLYFHGLLRNDADLYYQPGFQSPPGTQHLPATVTTLHMFEGQPIRTLEQAIHFVASMYGNAISRGFPVYDPTVLATLCGAVVLACGVGLWMALARQGRLEGTARAWTTFLLFAFLTAGLVSVGRLWAGPERALTPRYATYGTFCLLSVVMLAVLETAGAAGEAEAVAWRARRELGLVGAGVLIALVGVNWAYGLDLMTEWRETRLQTRAVIHFAKEPRILRSVFTSYPIFLEAWVGGQKPILAKNIDTLDRLGYWHPALAANARLDQFAIADTPLDAKHARIERAKARRTGVLEIEGHAHYEDFSTPHLILFASRDARGDRIIRAACLPQSPPRWRYRGLGIDRQFLFLSDTHIREYGHFACRIAPDAIPAGEPRKLEAFALDFAHGRVRRIPAQLTLPEAPASPSP